MNLKNLSKLKKAVVFTVFNKGSYSEIRGPHGWIYISKGMIDDDYFYTGPNSGALVSQTTYNNLLKELKENG